MLIPFSAMNAVPYWLMYQEKSPLVHCMTNHVVQNFTANVLLATGGSPAMVPSIEECGDFTTIASALLINVGTITAPTAEAMLASAKVAYETGTPWVLDPVAIGPALYYRTEIVAQLLQYKPTVIRGNVAEIKTLAGESAQSKGVDSQEDFSEAIIYAEQVARELNTVVAMTGRHDIITDGQKSYEVSIGTEQLTKVTGTGCSLSALVAALIGASQDVVEATATACYVVSLAGMRAAEKSEGMGSFAVSYLDELSFINADSLFALAQAEEEKAEVL